MTEFINMGTKSGRQRARRQALVERFIEASVRTPMPPLPTPRSRAGDYMRISARLLAQPDALVASDDDCDCGPQDPNETAVERHYANAARLGLTAASTSGSRQGLKSPSMAAESRSTAGAADPAQVPAPPSAKSAPMDIAVLNLQEALADPSDASGVLAAARRVVEEYRKLQQPPDPSAMALALKKSGYVRRTPQGLALMASAAP